MSVKYKSMWDGWVNQCFGKLMWDYFPNGTFPKTCALGHLMWINGSFNTDISGYLNSGYLNENQTTELNRVASYIRRNLFVPVLDMIVDAKAYRYESSGIAIQISSMDRITIEVANDVLKWTPQQFRDIDIASQIELEFKEQLVFSGIDPEMYEIGIDEAKEGADTTIRVEVMR